MEKIGIIYKVTNNINGKAYIGLTIQPVKSRWRQHVNDVKRRRTALGRAILKYGEDVFSVQEIASSWNVNYLCELEHLLIKEHNTMYPHGYNLRDGGNYGLMSDQTRQNMSIARKGEVWSKEIIEKRAAAGRGKRHPNNCKPVVQSTNVQDVFCYFGATYASADGFNPAHITQCCKKNLKYKQHKGYFWRYA